MKKTIITILLLALAVSIFAQQTRKAEVEVTYTVGGFIDIKTEIVDAKDVRDAEIQAYNMYQLFVSVVKVQFLRWLSAEEVARMNAEQRAAEQAKQKVEAEQRAAEQRAAEQKAAEQRTAVQKADEKQEWIRMLVSQGSDESAKILSEFLMELNTKRISNNTTREDEQLVRVVISALGEIGHPSARSALNAVASSNWTPAVVARANEALKQIAR